MGKGKERDTSRDYVEFCEVPPHIKSQFRHVGLDKGLKIVLYGPPFTDSRPRTNKFTKAVAMINLNKMKKVFSKLYDKSNILQNLVIISPFVLRLHAYKAPSQILKKVIKKESSKKIQDEFQKEELYDMAINDVDNMIKIHNDILFEPEYRICLDDAWNISDTECFKKLSNDPRVELYIYYCSKPNSFYQWSMYRSSKYYKYLISLKNWKIVGRTANQQIKHLKDVFSRWLEDKRSDKDVISFVKSTSKVLDEYPAVDLKILADMNDHRYTRLDARNKILYILAGKNSAVKSAIDNLDTGGKDDDDDECEGLYEIY